MLLMGLATDCEHPPGVLCGAGVAIAGVSLSSVSFESLGSREWLLCQDTVSCACKLAASQVLTLTFNSNTSTWRIETAI